jgi:hypothetical protein
MNTSSEIERTERTNTDDLPNRSIEHGGTRPALAGRPIYPGDLLDALLGRRFLDEPDNVFLIHPNPVPV